MAFSLSEVSEVPLPYLITGAAILLSVSLFSFTLFQSNRWNPPKQKDYGAAHPPSLTDEYKPYLLIEKENISHNTRRFRFALPSKAHRLGLPIGQHIGFKFTMKEKKEDGSFKDKDIIRSYTPTTSDDEFGYVDFVIKVYPGGPMSEHLDQITVGKDSILMRGPKGHLDYLGAGHFTVKKSREVSQRKATQIGMIAGGTGITPMLQVMTAILKDTNDKTKISLLFANQTEDDILCRDLLEDVEKKFPGRVKLWYTLDRPPATGWKYSKGFISDSMIKEHLPPPSSTTHIFMCGPKPMVERACIPNLKKLGYEDENIFAF